MLLAQWMKALLSSCTLSTAQEWARPVTITTPWSAGAENADVAQQDVYSCVKENNTCNIFSVRLLQSSELNRNKTCFFFGAADAGEVHVCGTLGTGRQV